jgi:hypothetical protein
VNPFFRGNSSFHRTLSLQANLSSHPSIFHHRTLLLHLPYRLLSPTSPQTGDSPSDSSASPSVSKSSPNLSIESQVHSSSHLSVYPLRYSALLVLKRGIATDPCFYPWSYSLVIISASLNPSPSSHSPNQPSVKLPRLLSLPVKSSKGGIDSFQSLSFVLDPPSSPKHFVRIVFLSTSFHRRHPRYIRLQDSTLVLQSSSPVFFQVSSLDLSSRHIKSSRKSWFPILALLWNSGKNWVTQRRDAVAKTGGRREGRECRAKHESEDGRGPQGKSLSTMLVMQDLTREEEDIALLDINLRSVCTPPPLGSRDGSSSGSQP